MSNATKSIVAMGGVVVMGLVFSRQLFLFAAFKESQGVLNPLGGRYHLWVSLLAAIFACIACALMFYFFRRYASQLSQRQPATRLPINAITHEIATAISAAPPAIDTNFPAHLVRWLPAGKSDDRPPVDGSVAESFGRPSGQRSFARESHQLKFKKWSQARRD